MKYYFQFESYKYDRKKYNFFDIINIFIPKKLNSKIKNNTNIFHRYNNEEYYN